MTDLTPWTSLKPQSPYAAIIDEMSCAKQNARNSATDGRSIEGAGDQRELFGGCGKVERKGHSPMKKNECKRVMKMRACEIWATSIDAGRASTDRQINKGTKGPENSRR